MEISFLTTAITLLLVFFKMPETKATDVKSQRKFGDATGENYIITHYGLEYYTPVDESAIPKSNGAGYFTAEVIPVDAKTGEEIKTVNNLYVPLHTGYSIGVSNEDASVHVNDRKDEKSDNTQQVIKVFKQPTSSKYNKTVEKKFKTKYANTTKKSVADASPSGSEGDNSSNKQSKRYAESKNAEKLFFNIFSTPFEAANHHL